MGACASCLSRRRSGRAGGYNNSSESAGLLYAGQNGNYGSFNNGNGGINGLGANDIQGGLVEQEERDRENRALAGILAAAGDHLFDIYALQSSGNFTNHISVPYIQSSSVTHSPSATHLSVAPQPSHQDPSGKKSTYARLLARSSETLSQQAYEDETHTLETQDCSPQSHGDFSQRMREVEVVVSPLMNDASKGASLIKRLGQ